jgi:site-specific recombinase XerD
MQHPQTAIVGRNELEVYAQSWRLALEADNHPRTTVSVYLLSVRQLNAFLASKGMPTAITSITAEHLREWQRDNLARCAPATAHLRHASMQAFFRWLVTEGELRESPLRTVPAPAVVETAVRVLTLEELSKLVAVCERDSSFLGRRDAALVRFLIDTGCRLAETTGLKVAGIDLKTGIVEVLGKGRRKRLVHLRPRTLRALDRYLRRRALQPHGDQEALWLGHKGPLQPSSVNDIIKRRAKEAGLGTDVHTHLLRHSFADQWLRNGGNEGDLMTLGGWKSARVMRRYAAGAATQRALQAHAQMEEKL